MSEAAAEVLLSLKVIPGAPRSEVLGWLGDAVKVKVKAPPVEGKANEALLRFLAEALDLAPRHLALVRGDTSRLKVIRIRGLDRETVLTRLGLG